MDLSRGANIDVASTELRKRTASLLASRYDEVRRVLTFLRWKEGDADRIAPSLHAVPKKRQDAKKEEAATAATQVAATAGHGSRASPRAAPSRMSSQAPSAA